MTARADPVARFELFRSRGCRGDRVSDVHPVRGVKNQGAQAQFRQFEAGKSAVKRLPQ